LGKVNLGGREEPQFGFGAFLLLWLVSMIVLAEPSPLKVPTGMVHPLQSFLELSEPQARVFVSLILRWLGIGMIGVLLASALRSYPLKWAALTVLLWTPLLSIGVKWIQFGYFPIRIQLLFIIMAALSGGLLGLALRGNRVVIAGVVLLGAAILAWGMSTRIGDDLDAAARGTGLHLLSQADQIPSGDEAFPKLLELAFAYAEDNSRGADPIFANQAAILALGIVLGDDQIARVGGRELDPDISQQREALRRKVTIQGRSDLPRHFFVSAALTVLLGEDQALALGIAKETADSLPGGSGFSFVDIAANQAGIRLAQLATQNTKSARRMQFRIMNAEIHGFNFMPEITGLPEGLSAAQFQNDYGGLGGGKSTEVFAEIERRIKACEGLQ